MAIYDLLTWDAEALTFAPDQSDRDTINSAFNAFMGQHEKTIGRRPQRVNDDELRQYVHTCQLLVVTFMAQYKRQHCVQLPHTWIRLTFKDRNGRIVAIVTASDAVVYPK